MPRERSFVAVKPDGVQRGLVGQIVKRFEARGLKLVALKMVKPTEEHAKQHYIDLAAKGFYGDLCKFLSSGPVVAMVWEGLNACKVGRMMLGATNPQESAAGSLRGDLSLDIGRNIIHASDGVESAEKEIALWFKPEEVLTWKPSQDVWVYENPEPEAAAPAAKKVAADPGPVDGPTLEVSIDKANMKNIDEVPRMDPWVKMEMGGITKQTVVFEKTLTPEWEEIHNFPVKDVNNDTLTVTVYLGDTEMGVGTFVLDKLKAGASTYKGVAVKGGRLDMTLRALNFGATAEEEEADEDWMSMI